MHGCVGLNVHGMPSETCDANHTVISLCAAALSRSSFGLSNLFLN